MDPLWILRLIHTRTSDPLRHRTTRSSPLGALSIKTPLNQYKISLTRHYQWQLNILSNLFVIIEHLLILNHFLFYFISIIFLVIRLELPWVRGTKQASPASHLHLVIFCFKCFKWSIIHHRCCFLYCWHIRWIKRGSECTDEKYLILDILKDLTGGEVYPLKQSLYRDLPVKGISLRTVIYLDGTISVGSPKN